LEKAPFMALGKKSRKNTRRSAPQKEIKIFKKNLDKIKIDKK
jgi:hypothetical protein